MDQLFKWAEKADDPLCSYATGLLAGAMDVQDVAANYKEKNYGLVSQLIVVGIEINKAFYMNPITSHIAQW